jgi:hypothetical protein
MPSRDLVTVVAGAAIFDDRGWMLSARRTLPLYVAGKWQFQSWQRIELGKPQLHRGQGA